MLLVVGEGKAFLEMHYDCEFLSGMDGKRPLNFVEAGLDDCLWDNFGSFNIS